MLWEHKQLTYGTVYYLITPRIISIVNSKFVIGYALLLPENSGTNSGNFSVETIIILCVITH